MDRYCKRLIEVDLPIKRISAHAQREKAIQQGHISSIHIWWARRPLAACRALICASLWPDPADDLCPNMFRKVAREQMTKWAKNHLSLLSEESWSRFVAISKEEKKLDDLLELRAALLDFIADFANWDNSTVPEYLEISRLLTQAAHEALGGEPNLRPLVVDPFAGGGAIPLEALRIGAESFSSDLNPVAVLINKLILDYIPKFGKKLVKELLIVGEEIRKSAEKELKYYYTSSSNELIPISYLWARTIRCEGPGCGTEIPLIGQLWLSKKKNKCALEILADKNEKKITFKIKNKTTSEDIDEGTVKRGAATCPICNYTTSASNVKKQFKGRSGGINNARLIAVVYSSKKGKKGRVFKLPTGIDIQAVKDATKELDSVYLKNNKFSYLIPNETLPYLRSIFNIKLLDVNNWIDLFSPRQLLSLLVFTKIIREYASESKENEFKKAIATCLAFALDSVADHNSTLGAWRPITLDVSHVFGRQALPISWDFAETIPIGNSMGSFIGSIKRIVRIIEKLNDSSLSNGTVQIASAVSHPLPDDSVDALITDPPYYDAVPFADLSDFFYVWLKRTIGELFPYLFTSTLTTKDGEIVQLAERNENYRYKTKEYFEKLMTQAMINGRRVLKPQGIGLVFFAHKTTSGWEAQLKSMIDAGWIITASWPIDTEKSSRLRAINSAVLASSIQLICRPRENPDGSLITDHIGDWRDVLTELPERIHEWMPRLAEEGVVGADAIFACLGPALEIYSRYSSVEKASGEKVSLSEYLEDVWAAVSREALNMIFEGADASGFEEDARLTAMWLWIMRTAVNGGNGVDENGTPTKSLSGYSLEYDAARKIAQGLGAHLENLSHLVAIKGNTAMLLSVAARTNYLFGKDAAEAPKGKRKKKTSQLALFNVEEDVKQIEEESGDWVGELSGKAGSTVLDQLHQSMILFAAGHGEAMKRFLVEEGVGRNPLFWRLAQALSALYPVGTDEKRWVDGVLARKKGLGL